MTFVYADIVRRLEALERELVTIRKLLTPPTAAPGASVGPIRVDVRGHELTGP